MAYHHVVTRDWEGLVTFLSGTTAGEDLDTHWMYFSKIPMGKRTSELMTKLDQLLDRGSADVRRGHLTTHHFVSAARFFDANGSDPDVLRRLEASLTSQLKLHLYLQSSASDTRVHGWSSDKRELAAAYAALRRRTITLDLLSDAALERLELIIASCYFFEGSYDGRAFEFFDEDASIFQGPPLTIAAESQPGCLMPEKLVSAVSDHNTQGLAAQFLKWQCLPYSVAQPWLIAGADLNNASDRAIAIQALSDRHRPVKVSAARQRIQWSKSHLMNLVSPAPRWHPEPARFVRALSAREDYMHLYTFPCCGFTTATDALTSLDLTPLIENGCQPAPPQVAEAFRTAPPDPHWPQR